MTSLWHFTCEHSHAMIGKRGLLHPHPHPLLPALSGLVWMTDDPSPERDAVGLTMGLLSCDRMAYRYEIRPVSEACVPWSDVRELAAADVLRDLESFGDPKTWWVSRLPVMAHLSPVEVAS